MYEEYKISVQFLINSSENFKLNLGNNSSLIQENIEEYIPKEMELKPTKNSPEEHYNSIIFNSTNIVLNLLKQLYELVIIDPNVENYVSPLLDKLIINIETINRLKIEKIMIIIKCGINPTCSDRTLECLCDLEYCLNKFYPPDRKNFPNASFENLQSSIFKTIISGTEALEALINKINFVETFTDKFKEMMINSTDKNNQKYKMILSKYLEKITLIETPIITCKNFIEIVDIINSSRNDGEILLFPIICVSFIVKNTEIYVEYYGNIDKRIGGSFSFDFLKKFDSSSKICIIFYFVMCHYCLMNEDNVLGINFPISNEEVNNIFIFLEIEYLQILKDKFYKLNFRNDSNYKIFEPLINFIEQEIRFHIQNL